MKGNSDVSFHAFIRGIIFIGFALLQLGMIISGSIRLYIAPTMLPFVYVATVVLFLLGILQVLRSTQKDMEGFFCDCGEDHSMNGSPLTKIVIYSIFISPIIFGFSLPDQVLDSSVAANRGIQYGSGIFTSPTANPERIVTEKSIGEVAETEQEGSDGDKYDEYYKDLAQAIVI